MNYDFSFSKDEINLVLKGLAELPAKESFNLINKILVESNKKEKEEKKDV